tara:strand:- start:113 stop:1216 length:1104 start_codon:yes stop_codon:yes gene_type:complete
VSKILNNYQKQFKEKIIDFWKFWFRKNRYQYKSLVGYTHAPFKSKNLNVNNEGFRSKTNFNLKLKEKNKPKIFFIGPSSLFGMPNLSDDETVSSIVENQLNLKNKNYNCFNFSLIGSKINSQFLLLFQILFENKPDIVVIYNGYNDITSGYYGHKFQYAVEIDRINKEAFETEKNKNNPIFHLDKSLIAIANLMNDKLFNKFSISEENLSFNKLKEKRRNILKQKSQPKNSYDFCQKNYLKFLDLCFYILNQNKVKTLYISESNLLSTNKKLNEYEKEYIKIDGELGLFKDSKKDNDIKEFKKIYNETMEKAFLMAQKSNIDFINFDKVLTESTTKTPIFFDNVHLSNEGAKILANEIVYWIERKLN